MWTQTLMGRRASRVIALIAISLACVGTARADTIVIDDTTVGTLYDGLVDGFPGLATFDGTADLTGNTLGVGLQDGVTEERGIAEMPLASLAGLTSGDIVSATLTFNIDDIVTTFGPGTSFDGTAPETIVLFNYAGNGSIDLADYQNVVGAPLAVVPTTIHGVITDATLAVSGPLFFDVDVTAALQSALDAADTHLGIVWATQDDLAFASLDDLGEGSAGPPGVGGSSMPFLTIETASSEPPVLSKNELDCQKTIGKEGSKLLASADKELTKCFDKILKAVSAGKDAADQEAACRKGLDPADPASKLSKARTKLADKIAQKCASIAPADIGSPCDGGATTIGDTTTCVADAAIGLAEEAVRGRYAAGCDLLAAVGLDGDFPGVCLAP